MSDTIYRQAAIDTVRTCSVKEVTPAYMLIDKAEAMTELLMLPSAQPESYKEKLKEIADKLSEKFAYMNTCPNERDIILGYLGVERPRGIHCNTDCIITKCECNHHYKKSPSAQPESQWIPCNKRLPKGRELVNVSCHDDSGDTSYDYSSCGWITDDGEYWIVDNEINNFVVAWMPLPKPYKGEDA